MKLEQRLRAAASVISVEDSNSDITNAAVEFHPDELGLKATLKPHQLEGVSWLIRRYRLGVNIILGDEMGLGKTLQAISFLTYLKVSHLSAGPFCELKEASFVSPHVANITVILCPLSVIEGWMWEVTNFAPRLKILKYVGEKENRRNLRLLMFNHTKQWRFTLEDLSLPFDLLLTTYDIALADEEFLCQIPWQYAIIDEAQRLKNPNSVLYKALSEKYIIPRRLLITGTPIQNNLTELWALLHFCMPLIFGTLEQFLSIFKEAENPSSDDARVGKTISSLRFILRAFMLRRTKLQLIESGTLVLPPLTEITVMAPMVSLQQKVYVSILRKELPRLLALSSGASGHQSLQNIVIQLRKTCSHPYLFPGIEPEPYEEGEHLVQASGKLIVLDRLLRKLHNSGHRVLLFAQMTHTLDILQDYLEFKKYSYERLDGSIRAEERFAAIRSFSGQSIKEDFDIKIDENSAFVFLISTRAGGVGLNLVAADTVIFFEQDWNPQVDKQALQRAHRIGQLNHVIAINIVTARSIEEVIMRRAERKMFLSQNVIDRSFDREGAVGVDTGDLRSIIFGLQNFDPTQKIEESELSELDTLAEKVTATRQEHGEGKRKIEMNYAKFLDMDDRSEASLSSITSDPEFDEASYLSWVEKFKESPNTNNDVNISFAPRKALDHGSERLHTEAARKKAEERKFLKWESLGYHSLAVKEPMLPTPGDILPDSSSLHFVYGDCTQPSKVCPSEPAIIFSCVDNSGKWGHGGMFDALSKLSPGIGSAYEGAAKFRDLHLGDLHLIKIEESSDEQKASDECILWVGLAVVQSYNPRRKVLRSDISIPDLERCLAKVSHSAAQNSASIHMPRIGYEDGSHRSVWYSVERLLRKYAAIYSLRIFVYYYRRTT